MEISYFGEIAEKTNKTSENLQEISDVNSLITFLKITYHLNESDFQIAVNHSIIEISEEKNLEEIDEIAVLSAFAGG
ncbi:MoaD/ThiS family protein [Halpernia frigidisoli]|uniref:ThiS family protein n=1 Tax=Halpernia frigidisoli TaxID=1125876 RepID=A0A1I3D4T5_9FLAO|nr:MoaD/ThiS family protein [Halpernia frigidisoli]SFH81608.1 ThiS family protein [Halpernia frigidisoli]